MNLNRSEKYFRNKQQGVSLKVRTYNLLNTDTDTRSHVFFCRRRVERESSRSDIDGMHTVGSNTPALSSFTTLVSTRRGGYDVPRVENARTGEVRTIHPNPTSMISAITLAHVHKYIRSIYSSIPSLSFQAARIALLCRSRCYAIRTCNAIHPSTRRSGQQSAQASLVIEELCRVARA